MTTDHPAHPAGSGAVRDSEDPLFWEPSLAYLKFTCAVLFAGALCFMLVVRILTPDQTARYVASAVAGTVALAAWLLVSQEKVKAAVYTLAIGAWIVITGVAFFFGGVRAPAIYAYPISIVLVGWLISSRLALWLAGLSAAIIIGFVFGESSGFLPTQPPTPAALHGVIQVLVMALSAALIYFLVRAYKNRDADLVELGKVLAQRSTELEARTAELQRAQTVARAGSWTYELPTDTMRLSAETCRIFGVPKGTRGNHDSYLALVDPQDRDDIERAWQASLAGPAFDHEHRIIVAGETHWIRQKAEFERAPDGTPLRALGVVQDITDRKQAEMALQESETRYRALVEWSPEAILVHGGGRILYANPACVALFGAASADELVGTPVIEVVHPDGRAFALARVKAMTDTGVSVPMVEELLVKRDGTPFEAEVQAKPIQYDGKPAIHIAMHDVSRRKREEAARLLLEAQLRESQKMQAIGTLAGGIAHDFNNIIATILGNAELAHQDAGANAPVQESLEEIRKAGARARDLVRQILSFSRREAPERRRIALAPVIEESVRLLRATLPARVSLAAHCDPGVPPVLADKTQIEQVLINLATNAAQAMGDAPGHIDMRLDAVLLDAALVQAHPALHALHESRPGRMVRMAVRDDGAGMDAATLGRIFEPFFTTKPVGEGTGLGLSVVHGIVQAHEGAILVESQPGRGTTFTVYLPAADAI